LHLVRFLTRRGGVVPGPDRWLRGASCSAQNPLPSLNLREGGFRLGDGAWVAAHLAALVQNSPPRVHAAHGGVNGGLPAILA
jgi:hypothetical protein